MDGYHGSRPTDMPALQIAFTVKGDVQGVNFRSSTQKQANRIGLTGFVTNASDGTVCVPFRMTLLEAVSHSQTTGSG